MNERDFCYWLQSAFELMDAKNFDEKQTELIRQHLQLVFEKKTDEIQTTALQPITLDNGGVVWPTIYPPYKTYCNTEITCDVTPPSYNHFGFGHQHVVGS